MTDADPEKQAERIRLLEAQLDFLRAELLHLGHERDLLTYSVSGHIYKALRPIEARIAKVVEGLLRRPPASEIAAPAGETTGPSIAHAPARRLLVDVTGTIKSDAGTGIQRVVKEVVRALYAGAAGDFPALAVRCADGRLMTASAFVASLGGPPATPDTEIVVEAGDRMLLLSDSWNAFDALAPVVARIRAVGGEIVSCIFDLIPELYPHACHEVTVPRYAAWLRRALIESDAFIAISATVAGELADHIAEKGLPHRGGMKIGWFQCGADLAAPATTAPRPRIAAAVAGDDPVFLCVSTLEPRKGQRVALQAFDALWAQDHPARLAFVGRRGWFDGALVAEIIGHAQFGRRLFWFDDVGDAELSYLYDHVAALILPSYAEGFGLPIIEAAARGRSVICSDIPVFREIGRDGALYFRVNDPQALEATIRDFLSGARRADPSRVLRTSWAEATRRIVSVIARDDWSRRLP